MRRIVNRYVNKRIDWIIFYDPDDIPDEVKNMFLGIISNYQQVLWSVTNTREEEHRARAYNALSTQELMSNNNWEFWKKAEWATYSPDCKQLSFKHPMH